jgi:hypothetical protein
MTILAMSTLIASHAMTLINAIVDGTIIAIDIIGTFIAITIIVIAITIMVTAITIIVMDDRRIAKRLRTLFNSGSCASASAGARCSGPQTRSLGLANKSRFEPAIRANMKGCEPTLAANEPTFIATSLQTAM